MAATISANSAGGGGLVTSGDASGVLALQTAGVTALSISAAQVVSFANPVALTSPTLTSATLTGATFTATPDTTTPQSMVRLNTSNGYGSTNTLIRRFTNIVTNQGSDITYADSATLGGSFTINTTGVYAVSHTDAGTSCCGLSLNTTQPTTAISTLTTPSQCLAIGVLASFGNAIWTGYLPSGSVVRAHHQAVNGGGTTPVQFTIVRIA